VRLETVIGLFRTGRIDDYESMVETIEALEGGENTSS
jgi:hypothetical protein